MCMKPSKPRSRQRVTRETGKTHCVILYSYRTGTSDSPVCECGKGNEIAEHFCYTVISIIQLEVK